jgi:hypothetical protein
MKRHREQTETRHCSVGTILRRPEFAQGLADIRAGKSPNSTLIDANSGGYWAYERGRLVGALMPLDWPLYIDGRPNPKVVELFLRASDRGLIQ